jgi:predicted AAA+ superfamily ATPase
MLSYLVAMRRYLENAILADLPRKIVLVTGPRQCGKTTLAQMLSEDVEYLNFDNPEHRLALMERSWDRSRQLVIFDELHKLKNSVISG